MATRGGSASPSGSCRRRLGGCRRRHCRGAVWRPRPAARSSVPEGGRRRPGSGECAAAARSHLPPAPPFVGPPGRACGGAAAAGRRLAGRHRGRGAAGGAGRCGMRRDGIAAMGSRLEPPAARPKKREALRCALPLWRGWRWPGAAGRGRRVWAGREGVMVWWDERGTGAENVKPL